MAYSGAKPYRVPTGGTGQTSLTDHGVLVGSGTDPIDAISPSGTTGIPLVSNGALSDPHFSTASVPGGGTGATTLTGVLTGNGTSAVTANPVTNHGVLVGGASNAVSSTAVGSTGQVLQGNTGANPTYSTATYPSTTTATQLLYSSATNVVGEVTSAIDGVLISSHANGTPSWLANSGTPGFVLTANSGAPPSWQAVPSSAMTWTDQSGSFSAAVTNGYFITNTSTATLPASPSEGNTISFVVDTTNVLTIQANTGQVIRIGSTVSTTAGTAASNARGDSVTLVYRSTGAVWAATSVINNWTLST